MFESMDKQKMYYLSHPYTTHGDMKQNKVDAVMIENILRVKHDMYIVNPVGLMPDGITDKTAMDKCLNLYLACDAVIMCDDWELSKGCKEEYAWAVKDKKPIYKITKNSVKLLDYSIKEMSA